MPSIGGLLYSLIQLFLLTLFARVILDYARIFAPQWRPRGIILALAEFIFSITDPIMKFARRYIPPLRLGPVAVDLSFIVILVAAQILGKIVLLIP
jgi:YggT family protein